MRMAADVGIRPSPALHAVSPPMGSGSQVEAREVNKYGGEMQFPGWSDGSPI